MERRAFESWLDAYGRAWETHDTAALAALFTDDATYQETPFESPMQGQAAICGYGIEARQSQNEVHFSYEVLAVDKDVGIARWRASFVRVPSGARVALDGILVAVLNDENRCSRFQEWWHRQETPASSSHGQGAGPPVEAD